MASNYIRPGNEIYFAVPATAASAGAPVELGEGLTGVTLTDRSTGGSATVDLGRNVWNLEVKAINDSGNTTIATWDQIYITMGDDPQLNVKTSGNFFGFSLESIATSGATATIEVLHVPAGGAGGSDILDLDDDSVSLEHLDSGITMSHMVVAAGLATTSAATGTDIAFSDASASTDYVFASSKSKNLTINHAYVTGATVHIGSSTASDGAVVQYQVIRAVS